MQLQQSIDIGMGRGFQALLGAGLIVRVPAQVDWNPQLHLDQFFQVAGQIQVQILLLETAPDGPRVLAAVPRVDRHRPQAGPLVVVLFLQQKGKQPIQRAPALSGRGRRLQIAVIETRAEQPGQGAGDEILGNPQPAVDEPGRVGQRQEAVVEPQVVPPGKEGRLPLRRPHGIDVPHRIPVATEPQGGEDVVEGKEVNAPLEVDFLDGLRRLAVAGQFHRRPQRCRQQ